MAAYTEEIPLSISSKRSRSICLFSSASCALLQYVTHSKRLIATARQETCLLNVIFSRTNQNSSAFSLLLHVFDSIQRIMKGFHQPEGCGTFSTHRGLNTSTQKSGKLIKVLGGTIFGGFLVL